MNRTSTWILFLSWFFLAALPDYGIAGPFDALKDLKLDPKTIVQPRENAAGFQFVNFSVRQDSGGASRVWNVDLKIGQSISTNTYVVKTVFQNRRGETLFSGEDIPLPAGNTGKIYPLTRPFQREPGASAITLQVHHRQEGKVVASRTYPLPAPDPSVIGGSGREAGSSVPQRGADRVPKADTHLDVVFVPQDPVFARNFRILNRSSFPVKIDAISAKAKFTAGADQDGEVECSPRQIEPGQGADCRRRLFAEQCPTWSAVEIRAVLNGTPFQEVYHFDSPVRPIKEKPIVRIEKKKQLDDQFDMAGGTVDVIIRGTYVRVGSLVTIKGLASMDSDPFPVVFPGEQRDDGIHGHIKVAGPISKYLRNNAPDKFCFNLMEVTTYDGTTCGGVGVLLYRNLHEPPLRGDVNWFLEYRECR